MPECRCEHSIDLADVSAILDAHADQPGALIPVLKSIQDAYGYLPREALEAVAEYRQEPLASVYGLATFYSQFHLAPRGEVVIRVCQGTACHVNGGSAVLAAVTEELGVGVGGTTPDGEFTLETAGCVGACSLAPVIVAGDTIHGRLEPGKAARVIRRLRAERSES